MVVHSFTPAAVLLSMLLGAGGLAAQEGPSGDTTYATQESSGEVTLALTPSWRDGTLLIALTANTHSVDLSQINLGTQVRLLIGDTALAPTETGSLDGHHTTARLVFPLAERPDVFTIEINDVPDVAQRTLTWPREAAGQPEPAEPSRR